MEIKINIPDKKPEIEKGFIKSLERIEKSLRKQPPVNIKNILPKINIAPIEKQVRDIKSALARRTPDVNKRISMLEREIRQKGTLNSSMTVMLNKLLEVIKKQSSKPVVTRITKNVNIKDDNTNLLSAMRINFKKLEKTVEKSGQRFIPSAS